MLPSRQLRSGVDLSRALGTCSGCSPLSRKNCVVLEEPFCPLHFYFPPRKDKGNNPCFLMGFHKTLAARACKRPLDFSEKRSEIKNKVSLFSRLQPSQRIGIWRTSRRAEAGGLCESSQP